MPAPMLRTLGFILVLGLAAPSEAQARIELARAGVESAAAPGNWCIAGAHKLLPGLSSEPVAIAGRSTGARVRALIVISQGGDRFRLTAGREAIATFTKSGNSPTQFWLAARPGTPPGVHTVRFRALAEDGTRSNEVSCLVDTHPAGLFPPELNPYALEVRPDSFVSPPSGGFVPSGSVDPRTRTDAPFATPETQIKLEARRKPGHAEPPPEQRRCTFEAVDAHGRRQVHEDNSCEGVVIRLPAGDYRLRLGFRYAETSALTPAYVERADYRVIRTLGTIVNPCVEPCTLRGNLCVRPSSGSGVVFACASDANCASDHACIDGACLVRCWDGSACPRSCQLLSDGTCVAHGNAFPAPINRYCASSADCDPGYSCLEGACRRRCTDSIPCNPGYDCLQGVCLRPCP